MKAIGIICLLIGMLCLNAFGQQPSSDPPEQLRQSYLAAVKALLPGIGAADANARRDPQHKLEVMSFDAGRPGAEADRVAFSSAVAANIGPEQPSAGRQFLLRILENTGRAEVVDAVAALLEDGDENVRMRAICALQNNPAPEAVAKLRASLERQTAPRWRIALINALGNRADSASASLFEKMLDEKDVQVATAAAGALGKLGTSAAATALSKKLAAETDESLHRAIVDSLLRCADLMLALERPEEAAKVFQSIYDAHEPAHLRIAALRGLAMSLPEEKSIALIAQVLDGDDAELQLSAGRFAAEIPGQTAARELARKLPTLSPPAQVILIRALAQRGDAAARPAIAELARGKEPLVRIAAIQALSRLGDEGSALLLAQAAAISTGAEQAAARESLANLPGANVDSAMASALPTAEPAIRMELIRGLAARRAAPQVPAILQRAQQDTDPAVRVEAINAVGTLGEADQLPALIAILASARTEQEARAAESAAAALMSRMPDLDRRAEPILSAIDQATGASRLALLRVLGRTGSPKALEVLRKAVAGADDEARLAAVRALAEWPDDSVANDLLALARTAPAENLKIIALRGYIRVAALPSTRAPEQTAKILGEAMALGRADEKRLVLAALANVPAIESLRLVESCVDNPDLRGEAVAAAIPIGKALAASNSDEVLKVMQKCVAATADENLRRQALDIVRQISGTHGFITDWMIAGPYMQPGKTAPGLFDVVFPPETGAADVKWKPMPKPGPGQFELNIATTDLAGDQRCAYLRTRVYVPKQQEVRLEMGSDDGIKVWLNGKVVHANNVDRGSLPGQDAVSATLNEGWNTLMLKITNGGGGWSCNFRICRPDQGKVEGLKVQAQ